MSQKLHKARRSGKTPASQGGNWLWRGTRWAIYHRDDFCCVYCKAVGDITLDHVVPTALGGSNDSSNLVTCCSSCNLSKGNLSKRKWFSKLRERKIDTAKLSRNLSRLLRTKIDHKKGLFLASTRVST